MISSCDRDTDGAGLVAMRVDGLRIHQVAYRGELKAALWYSKLFDRLIKPKPPS